MKPSEIQAAIKLGKSFSDSPTEKSGDAPVSPNFTPTKDPNVVIGKYGAPITYDEFVKANKNGYAWKDFSAYADYVGGWARPNKPLAPPPPPYYRAYGGGENINSGDVAILQTRYADEPMVQQILQRNIAKTGEIPMFGADDADAIKALILKEKNTAQTYKIRDRSKMVATNK